MLLGTYSSQISGGSTMWLSQSKMEKSLLAMAVLRGSLIGWGAGSHEAVGPILHTRRPSARPRYSGPPFRFRVVIRARDRPPPQRRAKTPVVWWILLWRAA